MSEAGCCRVCGTLLGEHYHMAPAWLLEELASVDICANCCEKLLRARNAETPTAPATPALSQIRSASPGLAELGSELMCLHKAATPGPWIANFAEPNMTGHALADARVEATGELTGVVCNQAWNHDAAFIAFARTALPALLSIADMLYAENAKLKKGLVEVVDYCEKEMQPWENEGIPAYEPSIVDLHNIALSALRSIAQMEEGKT